MTEDDDDLFVPSLSASPATSPILASVSLGALVLVAAVSLSGCSGGETPPPRSGDSGPPRDTSPGEGRDASFSDVGVDASDAPRDASLDSAAPDAGVTDGSPTDT